MLRVLSRSRRRRSKDKKSRDEEFREAKEAFCFRDRTAELAEEQAKVYSNPVRDVEKPSDPDGEIRMHILTLAEEMDYFNLCEKAGYRNLVDVSRVCGLRKR